MCCAPAALLELLVGEGQLAVLCIGFINDFVEASVGS